MKGGVKMKKEKSDNLEKDLEKVVNGKAEVIVTSTEKALSNPNFFQSLMKFQYGEGEESDQAFEDIKKRVKLMPDPEKVIIKRIIQELQGSEKHRIFVDA